MVGAIRMAVALAASMLLAGSNFERAPVVYVIKPVMIDYRPAILAGLERAITRHEHCVKWNNPGCLAFAGQAGGERLANGYARFRTEAEGRVALERDLTLKLGRGMTVAQVMVAWNGGGYLADVLAETGFSAETRWEEPR